MVVFVWIACTGLKNEFANSENVLYKRCFGIHTYMHVYLHKVNGKCKQDRKVMQDSYDCPKSLN